MNLATGRCQSRSWKRWLFPRSLNTAVYEEWTRASADPSVSDDVLASLQDEYLARQKKSEAQQQELSEIIDILGYVPEVPLDDEK